MISLTNPHTIRGRPTLKDVERFRNGSFHEFCRLKALITLKEVNTSDVQTRKNVHEQTFDDEVKDNKQIVVNLSPVQRRGNVRADGDLNKRTIYALSELFCAPQVRYNNERTLYFRQ